ncbi:MAG TPA: hypothetical protein VMD09_15800 [Solirubrobacteraceae bacterium]|nr:hypothetical protein [Solirubrobacteraceae bacterium]
MANSTAEERRGVPFANKQYYDQRWAPAVAGVGALLLVVGAVWFLVAGL